MVRLKLTYREDQKVNKTREQNGVNWAGDYGYIKMGVPSSSERQRKNSLEQNLPIKNNKITF